MVVNAEEPNQEVLAQPTEDVDQIKRGLRKWGYTMVKEVSRPKRSRCSGLLLQSERRASGWLAWPIKMVHTWKQTSSQTSACGKLNYVRCHIASSSD